MIFSVIYLVRFLFYHQFIHQATCFVNSDVVFTHSGNLIQTILSSGKENTLSEEDMERIKKVLGQ